MRSKRISGLLGLLSAAIFAAAAVISILIFEHGTYSPVNCYITELGLYRGTFLTVSSALVFNIGLMLSGLIFGVFMIMYGLRNEAPFHTAISFFGVLSGILIAAQGLFSINFYTYHYVLASAFFVSLFLICVLYIVSNMLSGNLKRGLISIIITFFTGAAAALSAGYMITGGMAQVYSEDALGIGRANIIPFTIIGWAAFALLFVFIVVLSIHMLAEKENPAKLKSASPSAGPGSTNQPSKPKRSAKTPAHSYVDSRQP